MRELRPTGVHVLLGKACPDDLEDNRNLVIRYLPDERFWLNEQPLSETELRRSLSAALERRMEKLVWVAADERVAYGGVVDIISKLKSDTADLNVAIMTKSLSGPVDPVEIARMNRQLTPTTPILMLCLPQSHPLQPPSRLGRRIH